jgi:hypothetical protein
MKVNAGSFLCFILPCFFLAVSVLNPVFANPSASPNSSPLSLPMIVDSKNVLTKGELVAIIKKRYKNARVKDVDIETFNGKKVYDVDFIYRGKPYEAFITRQGRLLKVQLDPNVDDGD